MQDGLNASWTWPTSRGPSQATKSQRVWYPAGAQARTHSRSRIRAATSAQIGRASKRPAWPAATFLLLRASRFFCACWRVSASLWGLSSWTARPGAARLRCGGIVLHDGRSCERPASSPFLRTLARADCRCPPTCKHLKKVRFHQSRIELPGSSQAILWILAVSAYLEIRQNETQHCTLYASRHRTRPHSSPPNDFSIAKCT